MVAPCVKKDSTPSMCAVHNVVLLQKQVPIDQIQPGLGSITCFICPVTNAVVLERGSREGK
jgi:hypothetical protein